VRAMVYTKPGTVELLEVGEPVAGPGEVVVEVVACGICGSELHGISKPGFRQPPLVMGHEFSARTPSGDSVAVDPIVSCGQCILCRDGHNEVCRERSIIGIHRQGAFAERVAVPERALHKLPEPVPVEQGALVEPLANALHAWRLAGGTSGSTVGVLGAGSIGLSMLLVSKHYGARVSITDISPERLELAKRLGADATSRELDGEFHVVVDAVGGTATRRASLEHLAPTGTAVWLGLLDPGPDFDALDMIRMEKRIAGSFAYSHSDFADAVALAAEVDLSWATSFDLDQGPTIFGELMAGRSDVVKALLHPRPLSPQA
jgi:threonine dehydrogenase-like Zn-dependent dehydrogenase